MTDTFSFIFSRSRQVTPGEVRNIMLSRTIVDTVIAGLSLGDFPPEQWALGCQAELADFLMTHDSDVTPELCFNMCVSVLLLLLACDKIDQVLAHAGLVVWFDRDPGEVLQSEHVTLRLEGYTQEEVDEVVAAMTAQGSNRRDLAAELRADAAAETKGAT